MIRPKPLFEAADAAGLLDKIRARHPHLSAKAARATLCNATPSSSLCLQSECSDSSIQFVWYERPEHWNYQALLVVYDAVGAARAYDAGSTSEVDPQRCLGSDHKPNCGESGVSFRRTSSTSVVVSYRVFFASNQWCDGVQNDQTWLFDDTGAVIAVVQSAWASQRVTVTDSEVQLDLGAWCKATVSRAELAARAPQGEIRNREY